MVRRVYGELVRRRTRVEVIQDSAVGSGTAPRFLLSPYRSGTTLFRYCIDSHPDLSVPPETDFIVPLSAVLEDDPSVTGLEDMGFSEKLVEEKLSQFARGFFDTYALGRGASLGWMDKSPRYAEWPEKIERLFPDGKFVVMHRFPLDQIHSFTKGGTFTHPALGPGISGHDLIIAGAQYWRDVSKRLVEFARNNGALVITYEELCEAPEAVLRAALQHFDVPWNESVLNYHQFKHDVGREAGRVSGTVGFSVASGGWRSWPADWAKEAWLTVESVAEELGYERPKSLD